MNNTTLLKQVYTADEIAQKTAEMITDILESFPNGWDIITYCDSYDLLDYEEETDTTTINRDRTIDHFKNILFSEKDMINDLMNDLIERHLKQQKTAKRVIIYLNVYYNIKAKDTLNNIGLPQLADKIAKGELLEYRDYKDIERQDCYMLENWKDYRYSETHRNAVALYR